MDFNLICQDYNSIKTTRVEMMSSKIVFALIHISVCVGINVLVQKNTFSNNTKTKVKITNKVCFSETLLQNTMVDLVCMDLAIHI